MQPPPPKPSKALKSLGTKRVGNIFVQLRKIAQHPLLVRRLYADDAIANMATICRRRCAARCTQPASAAGTLVTDAATSVRTSAPFK